MIDLLNIAKGRGTYAVGTILVLYVAICAINATEVDEAIVTGLIGAMGLTIRRALPSEPAKGA